MHACNCLLVHAFEMRNWFCRLYFSFFFFQMGSFTLVMNELIRMNEVKIVDELDLVKTGMFQRTINLTKSKKKKKMMMAMTWTGYDGCDGVVRCALVRGVAPTQMARLFG